MVSGGSRFEVIGKSVCGAAHRRTGKPCQDSFRVLNTDSALVISVADGHGSAACPYSKSGSAIAVNIFCKIMSEYLVRYSDDMDSLRVYLTREGDTTVAKAIDREWKRRVEKSYRRRSGAVGITERSKALPKSKTKRDIWRMFGTTLLGLVVTQSFLFAFQLGDGDILFIRDGEAEPIVSVEKMLGTETRSLSEAEAWMRAKTEVCPSPSQDEEFVFMLTTDGFANSYRSDALFLQTAQEYFRAIREYGADAVGENLPAWLNETSEKGSGDDVTVLIAYPGGMAYSHSHHFAASRRC
jgi:serine/threonine protein phosphatase PrpC